MIKTADDGALLVSGLLVSENTIMEHGNILWHAKVVEYLT